MKTCKNCLVEKSLDEFYTHKRTRDGKGSWCKKCLIDKTKEARKDPSKTHIWSEYSRRSILKSRYGITAQIYDDILLEQQGVCAICQIATGGGRGPESKLAVDHDHVTGEVRGLLCNNCNNGLGRFKDNPELLQKAIDYLKS